MSLDCSDDPSQLSIPLSPLLFFVARGWNKCFFSVGGINVFFSVGGIIVQQGLFARDSFDFPHLLSAISVKTAEASYGFVINKYTIFTGCYFTP